ncbi:large subunit ribosomal protein L25 [Leucobacter exalbidus]|uniref:Large ribosomal subunit protein bL25 n=1 Tax=Leucobacter exalbidus TaxID=662960 RepID=A0A940PKI9_9MICO|nr:50S ribosomal protein L25/general stress protein Ctc [Leucobacter exalbidus]MBP1325612.1 large subunit ribosomal protein L25 [Leucobacter exalbidus]
MSKYQLEATVREQFGKGAARKLRAAGKTPVVVYGHGTAPLHVTVETHPLSLIIRQANALIELNLNDEKHLVLVKDVQRDPVPQIIEHVDLLIVAQGEAVEVEVPLHLSGEPFSGTSALQELNTIRLSVPATSIPENVVVDITGLEADVHVLVRDVVLPEGATAIDAGDLLVVKIAGARGAAEDEVAAE